MINLLNISMGFTQRTLFKDVTLSIFPKEKIGLTGPNGAGKSTLFSIIRGEMEPVAGSIQIQRNINIGHLPQEAKFHSTKTVLQEMTEGDDRIRQLMEEKRRLEDEDKAGGNRYGDVLHELEVLGIYDLEHKAEKILAGLGFKPEDVHKPITQLSGGWQMRTLLAKLLVYPFDLLLLDEPTNYLDLEATLWLKDFLGSYPGAFVLISHDRVFLNSVTNYTILLEGAKMIKMKGNYEEYEEQKEIQLKTLEKQQKVVEKKRQQLERFTERFHAQPNRASAVRNKRKMLERLEEIDLPQEHRSIGVFEFSDVPESGYVVARLDKICKAYGEKKIYENLDFEIIRGQKVCLVGPNGAGKSTLLKMLAGVVLQDSGEVRYGHNVSVGYFSQSRLDVLQPERTAFDEVMANAGSGTPAVKARSLLGLFNFHGDDVFKTVKILSGGEKSRVILAKLLINPPNFMLLDEPTTHLDLDGIKALTAAFQNFTGTVCFISHDLYFIREISDCIVDVNRGQIKTYPGGLEYYLDKKYGRVPQGDGWARLPTDREKAAKTPKPEKNAAAPSGEKTALAALAAEHKQALQRMDAIRKEIAALRQEDKQLETESYVKSRQMTESYGRDAAAIKESGRRLKEIQSRRREIETTLEALDAEKRLISK
ncbi:MAG: ATP-binding cassette domain-containing protein [Candidatus Omnitrophica bacterium]|nr:ATP-binding cassette domain-containing protein [Candidatus Omnitrophota bacterium]